MSDDFADPVSAKQPPADQLVAVGSFLLEKENYIDLVRIGGECFQEADASARKKQVDQSMRVLSSVEHPYLPCRMKWAPVNSSKPILASCSAEVNLWGLNGEDDDVQLRSLMSLSNKKGPDGMPAPITSIDWNTVDPTLLGTCSIDTTCTIWNVTTGQAKTQLIAHDKQVYDFAFSTTPDIFASVGGDGSVRLFDLRNLEHSTILYETPDHVPLLRLAWNKLDHHFMLTFSATAHKLILLDTRYPSAPVAELLGHHSVVNDVTWSPHSSAHACSVADDRQVFIWNLLDTTNSSDTMSNVSSNTSATSLHTSASLLSPSLMFHLASEGNQVIWPSTHPEWISVTESDAIRWIHV